MNDAREEIEKLLQKLGQERDELRVKLNLAKLEARDEWDRLEQKWEHLRARAPEMRQNVSETATEVAAAARTLMDDIRKGYERIRKTL